MKHFRPHAFWKLGALPPTISTLNYSQGAPQGGGQSIIVTGTNLSSASAVTIGGNSATITGNTSTTVTFTLPAHAAGSVTVSVTTPGGTSGTLAFEYWSPAQITGVDSYFDSNLGASVSAWTDQIGTRNVSQASAPNQPSITANAFGTLPGVTFVAGTQFMTAGSVRTFASGISVFCVYKSTDARASAGYPGDAPNTWLGDATGGVNCGFGLNGNAVEFETFNAVWTSTNSGNQSMNDGGVHMGGTTFSTGNAIALYKGATNVGTGTQTYGNLGNPEWNTLGGGFNAADSFGGTMGAMVIVQAAALDAKLFPWAQQRFGAT